MSDRSVPAPAPAVCIETHGCAFNQADEEAMAALLAEAGFRLVREPSAADLLILNTCTVKGRTQLDFEKRLRALRAAATRGTGPALVVAGCIPAAVPNAPFLAGLPLLGPDSLGAVAEVAAAALAGQAPRRLVPATGGDPCARARLPVARRNPVVEILPIARGCLGACAFCQTRLARGRLVSFPLNDLVGRARRALDEGARELWVTAQDTGAWGRELGAALPDLLGALCALPGDFRVRLGMANPRWVHEHLDACLDALAHPRMFRFLHVPVQSGSAAVLRAMRRDPHPEHFAQIAAAFHARFPLGALMTDIIAGFPGERDEDFAATLALLERAAPACVNRSRFSPRPGTPAAALAPPPGPVVAARMGRLNEAAAALARSYHARWVGRRERVLVAEARRPGRVIAHNEAWRPIDLPGDFAPGSWVEAQIVAATDYHLQAQPLCP